LSNSTETIEGDGALGSRMMHLIIAKRISEQLTLQDRSSFLIGSIAPDAVVTKNESHFFVGEIRDFTRRIDYEGFLDKYSEHAQHSYILGYYVHLIADDIWLRGFNLSWLRNRMEADQQLYRLYHNDFRLLNGKLLEHYQYAEHLKEMLSNDYSVINLDEVRSNDVEAIVPQALGDMEVDNELLNEPLNVFTMLQMIGYIETAVDLAVLKLSSLVHENSSIS